MYVSSTSDGEKTYLQCCMRFNRWMAGPSITNACIGFLDLHGIICGKDEKIVPIESTSYERISFKEVIQKKWVENKDLSAKPCPGGNL